MISAFDVRLIVALCCLAGCQSEREGKCSGPQYEDVGPGYPAMFTIVEHEAVEGCNYRATVVWDWQPDDTVLPTTILTRHAPINVAAVGTFVWTDAEHSSLMSYQWTGDARLWAEGWPSGTYERGKELLRGRMSADTEAGIQPATPEEALMSGAWRNEPRPATECEPLAWPPPVEPPPEYPEVPPCYDEIGPGSPTPDEG
jgi:hypothetical protein